MPWASLRRLRHPNDMGTVHIEFWQFLAGQVMWTGAIAAVIWRLTKYLTIEEYKEKHKELEYEVRHGHAEHDNRIRDLEIAQARRNGQR